MASLGEQIVDVARTQVGVIERPKGSNRGGSEVYQRLYGGFYVGLPWCGCFAGWVVEQVKDGTARYVSPSTAAMCVIASVNDLHVKPQPGAFFVICGTHTGIIARHISGSVWETIEGNSDDQVAVRQRDLRGTTIYGIPGIAKNYQPPVQTITEYWLEDLRALQFYGGWDQEESRTRAQKVLEDRLGHRLRAFNRKGHKTPYWLEDLRETQYYGPWAQEASREHAQAVLEKRLGHRLRAFNKTRIWGGEVPKPDDLGRTT